MSRGRGTTTDETRGNAVNGRTDVKERRQATAGPASAARRSPRGPAAAGPRLAGPRPAGARPATAPPVPRRGRQGPPSGAARTARPPLRVQRHAPQTRTRFVFLVVGLLGGGLLSLLMINTILAAGAFQITALQQGNVVLAQREQALQAQISAEESPASLAQRAAILGMRIQPRLHFLNLSTGRLESQPGQMPGIPTVPGYTP